MELIFVLAGAVGIVLLIPIVMYNSLISKRNQVENAFGSMDAVLKQRYDLIPNLISSVQTYMTHEKDVLTNITELRSKAISSTASEEEKISLDGQMSKALSGLMISVENYPDLKANQNFLQLQGSLNETEEKISAARRNYNRSVTNFNNSVEMFPSNIMAGMMRLKRKQVFEIEESERAAPNVKNLFNN